MTDQNQPMPEPQTGLDRFQGILRRNPIALIILVILGIGFLVLLSNLGSSPSSSGSIPSDNTSSQSAPRQTYEDAEAALKRGDYATAMRIIRPLADQGNAKAQGFLGTIYNEGWGVPKDYAEAVKWFRRAANQGDGDAEGLLGSMYRDGTGVPQDYVRAYMWLTLAAQSPGLSAQYPELDRMVRGALAHKMTPAQIAEAQKLASEWKPAKQSQ